MQPCFEYRAIYRQLRINVISAIAGPSRSSKKAEKAKSNARLTTSWVRVKTIGRNSTVAGRSDWTIPAESAAQTVTYPLQPGGQIQRVTHQCSTLESSSDRFTMIAHSIRSLFTTSAICPVVPSIGTLCSTAARVKAFPER
jgi:hypothetical protein